MASPRARYLPRGIASGREPLLNYPQAVRLPESIATDTAAPWQLAWDTALSGNGAHSLVARAYDALANVGTSSAVPVTAATPGLATYDPVLRAPRCATAGSVCDTGGLVNGRAALGPEPNAPNTLGGTCPDDTGGSYHASESLDRLRIYTTDGGPLTAGKPFTLEATVWASAASSTYDLLDVYYTSTPAAPVWTLLATLSWSGTGAHTFTWPFTLPQGAQHAIRGQLRFWDTPTTACVAASTSDRDDLVFTAVVGPDTTPPTTSITSPAAGAGVSGTIPVTTATSDNVGVTSVELLLDNKVIATATAAPWSFTWNTRNVPSKSHSLRTRARDAAGNVGLSPIVTVTVAN